MTAMPKNPVDPETPDEWRRACNLAVAMLRIDAARLYGLVRGGPEVDADRCADIIRRGKALGFFHHEADVMRIIRGLLGLGENAITASA